MKRPLLFALLIFGLAGCATTPTHTPTSQYSPSGTGIHHTVKSGETLWSISKMYGADLSTLVRVNSLDDSAIISSGQVLLIPRSSVARAPIKYSVVNDSFVWPVRGYVFCPFGAKVDRIQNKGIDIRSDEGASVMASRAGKVVYCDPHLKGFGKTVIVDHGDNYQTVYSYNSEILVNVGDIVTQRQVIAKVGMTGRAKEPSLHFEIRKNGEPHNPNYYLPRLYRAQGEEDVQ